MQDNTIPWSRPNFDPKKEKLANIASIIFLAVITIFFALLAVFLFLLEGSGGYDPKAIVIFVAPALFWYLFYSECQRDKRKRPITGVRVWDNKALQVQLEDGHVWTIPYDMLQPYLGDWLRRDEARYCAPITDGENVKWKSGRSLSLYQISTLGLAYSNNCRMSYRPVHSNRREAQKREIDG